MESGRSVHEPDARTPEGSTEELRTVGGRNVDGRIESYRHPDAHHCEESAGRSEDHGAKAPFPGRAIGKGEPESGGQGRQDAVLYPIHAAPAGIETRQDAESGSGDRARGRARDAANQDSTGPIQIVFLRRVLARHRARDQGKPEG